MGYYYSTSKNAFYTDELTYPDLPEDLIAIPDSQYQSLLTDINNGKEIVAVNGELASVDRAPVAPTWDAIRRKRNNLLTRSDYTQVLDWPGDKNTWAIYRQSLRDIPQTFSTPEEVVWPIDPEE